MSNDHAHTPVRDIYHGAGDHAVSIIESTLDAYPALRADLARHGLGAMVDVYVTNVAHKAQIIALADLLEYLMPILSAALQDRPDLRDELDALRIELVRERDSFRLN